MLHVTYNLCSRGLMKTDWKENVWTPEPIAPDDEVSVSEANTLPF
jgi:hypothetical protein